MKNICYLSVFMSFLLVFSVEAHNCDLINPSDPEASVPEIVYQSPFKGYQSFQKLKLRSWRQANEEVKQSAHDMGHMNMKDMNMQEPASDKTSDHKADHSSHMKH